MSSPQNAPDGYEKLAVKEVTLRLVAPTSALALSVTRWTLEPETSRNTCPLAAAAGSAATESVVYARPLVSPAVSVEAFATVLFVSVMLGRAKVLPPPAAIVRGFGLAGLAHCPAVALSASAL